MTKEWLQAQLVAYSLQQTNTREDLSGRYAEIILTEMRKEKIVVDG
jgi:hypothetical protein